MTLGAVADDLSDPGKHLFTLPPFHPDCVLLSDRSELGVLVSLASHLLQDRNGRLLAVTQRVVEGGEAEPVYGVDDNPLLLDEVLEDRRVPVRCCQVERCTAVVVGDVDLDPVVHQHLHHPEVSPSRQRTGLGGVVALLEGETGTKVPQDGLDMTSAPDLECVPHRVLQRRSLEAILTGYVGLGGQQELHKVDVPLAASQMQRLQ
eukprot:764383-Hanusia_phi.AAC.2